MVGSSLCIGISLGGVCRAALWRDSGVASNGEEGRVNRQDAKDAKTE
jgi:hypothetical protein